MPLWKIIAMALSALLPTACNMNPPMDLKVVDHFELNRYLGTWYEIARLDHRFERGLDYVTANYSANGDNKIKVINRGFDPQQQRWREAVGKGYFTGSPQQGSLKVSFFGPFYGGYYIIDLGSNYDYALVAGPTREYLWILARTPTISPKISQELLTLAKQQGFAVEKLIWVRQS